MISSNITHPLPLNTRIQAAVAGCACRGSKVELVDGTILKVIPSQQGVWYYLDIGKTVNQAQVRAVLSHT